MTAKIKNKCLDLCNLFVLFVLICLPSSALALNPDAYEKDNNRYQAKLIFPNDASKPHNFHAATDKDWMMFNVTKNDSYTIRVTNVGEKCNPVINLYSDGSALPIKTWSDSQGSGQARTCSRYFSVGAYYLELYNATGSNDDTGYDISIARDSGPEFPGTILGMVFDSSENPIKPIAGAKIHVNGKEVASSDGWAANGKYYPGLIGFYMISDAAGDYSITAEAEGYEKYQPPEPVTVYGANITVYIINMVPDTSCSLCKKPKTYCVDSDLDGRGDPETETRCIGCNPPHTPDAYVEDCSDCNDSNASVYPGAIEKCDGRDNDCDTISDEPLFYYLDSDGDGYGDENASPTPNCSISDSDQSTYSLINTDCNDADASINTDADEICDGKDNDCDGQTDECCVIYYKDSDQDGYSDGTSQTSCTRPDGYKPASELTAVSGDCNDNDPDVNPGKVEICNEKDDNCNGQTNEGCATTTTTNLAPSTTVIIASTTTTNVTTTTTILITFYKDGDGDGYGDPNNMTSASRQPEDYVTDNSDCNDSDKWINPSAEERCNGLDDNCNGQYEEGLPKNTYYMDADGDGYGHHDITTVPYCTAPVGFVENNSDCDDSDPSIHPGAKEICNDKDDNCNGEADEEIIKLDYCKDADKDGYGDPKNKVSACQQPDGYLTGQFCNDCNDNDKAVNPGVIECEMGYNGKDDDCDGEIDEAFEVYYQDSDKDGYGNPEEFKKSCTQPDGFVKDETDCDDTDPTVPSAAETCNGKDDNCDGQTDECCVTYYKDSDNDGYSEGTSEVSCEKPDGYKPASELLAISGDCDDTDSQINPISLSNVIAILKILTGIDVKCWSDANGDGKVGLDDVIFILQKLVGSK